MAEKLEFTVQDPQGAEHTFTDDFLLKSYQQAGQPVVGMTEDGTSIKVPADKPGKEPIDVSWADVLKGRGFTVTGMKPVSADYDNINLGWSALADKLTDDQEKKDFLGVKMRGLGHEDTKIIGQGQDWYAYNPATTQWVALTNKPGLDSSDFVRLGLEVPRFLGSVAGAAAGAALGAPTGPGAIAAAAGGAGLGGGAGEGLTRAALAAYDPDFREATSLASQAKDVGIGAGVDAATMGAFRGLGALAPGLKSLSPIATTARATGAAAEGAGSLASKAGGFVAGNDTVADLASMAIPGVGTANAAGWLMRAPRDIISAIPKGLEWVGSKLQGAAPDVAKNMVGAGRQLGRGAEESLSRRAAQGIERGLYGGGAPAAPVEASAPAALRQATQAQPTAASVMRNARGLMQPRVPLAEETAGAIAKQQAAQRGTAEAFGRGVDALGAAGEGLTKGSIAITQGLARGVQGAGKLAQSGGAALRRLGTLGQPMEPYAYTRAGTNELDKWIREKLRRLRLRDTMRSDTVLASQE